MILSKESATFWDHALVAGSLGKTRALAQRFVPPLMCFTQGIDSRIDLAALAFEVADLRRDLLRQQTHLEFGLAGILSPASKDVVNLGQRKSELLAFKNHLEMNPVAGIVPAIGAFPSRVQQAAVFIKPEGLDARHLVFPNRHVRLGRGGATCCRRRVGSCPSHIRLAALNSNPEDNPVSLRMQLKSVIKCNTPKNRAPPERPGFLLATP